MTQPPQWGPQPRQWGPQPPPPRSRPPQWGPPQPPQSGPQRRIPSQRTLWLVVAGVGALIAVIVVVLVSSNSSDSSTSSSGTARRVTGTEENWIESVCRTGTFVDGEGLPDANGRALCKAKNGWGIIAIGEYDSDFKMRNAIAVLRKKYYVSGIEPDGTVVVFVADQGGASILEPLTQFGFTINTAPQDGGY